MSERNVAVACPAYSPVLPRAEQIRAALYNPSLARALHRVFALAILLALALILVANAWLSWILTSGVMGSSCALLAVSGLVACAAAVSHQTGQGFVSALIFVGFAGFTVFFAALYIVAGHAMILGD